MVAAKNPFTIFGAPFGIAGLGGVWSSFSGYGYVTPAVGDGLLIVAAIVWSVLLVGYGRSVKADFRRVRSDVADPVGGPLASLIVITPMLFGQGLYPHEHQGGKLLVDGFIVLTVLFGGWMVGRWISAPLKLDTVHPGYFLPTVAGGLIAAASAARVGQHRLGEAMLGLGIISWIIIGSVVMGRLMLGPPLPAALQPTLAIQIAPAAVASIAWFALRGDHVDTAAAFLGGYGLLMVLAQGWLLRGYTQLPYMPSTWAFTFSWAAVATTGMHWIHDSHVAGYVAYSYAIIIAVTILIGGIALRAIGAALPHRRPNDRPRTPPQRHGTRSALWAVDPGSLMRRNSAQPHDQLPVENRPQTLSWSRDPREVSADPNCIGVPDGPPA